MKVRNGFVSNSSSSSFCVFGVELALYKAAKLFDVKLETDETDEEYPEDEYEDNYDLYEAIDAKVKKIGLNFVVFGGEFDDAAGYYLGLDLQSVKSKISPEELSKKIVDVGEKLKEYFPDKKTCIFYGSQGA